MRKVMIKTETKKISNLPTQIIFRELLGENKNNIQLRHIF